MPQYTHRELLPRRSSSSEIIASNTLTSEVDIVSTKELPLKKHSKWLHKVHFSKSICNNNDVCLELARFNSIKEPSQIKSDIDIHGMAMDSWWMIKCKDVPDRYVRLTDGSKSMTQLLLRYGFMDSSECINHRILQFTFSNGDTLPDLPIRHAVPRELEEATGIPQFFQRSGICWFNTMCWTSFANPRLRTFLLRYMEKGNPEAASLATTCLFKRADALQLRVLLWKLFKLGDNVDDKPENDGRNGCSEFTLMCARFGIPIIRYRENEGTMVPMQGSAKDYYNVEWKVTIPRSLNEEFLLVLRFHESNHDKYRIYPRILYLGQKYDLCGMYLGQSKCGHQIGVASTTGHWRDWGVADADMHKDGIGPIFFRFEGKKWTDTNEWWRAWRYVIHVTKFGAGGAQMCNHSPHNPGEEGRRGSGNNSVDAIYIRRDPSSTAR